MPELSVGEFLSVLRQSGVLSAQQWSELRQEVLSPSISRRFARTPTDGGRNPPLTSTETRSPPEIVQWLIDRNWLTRWQGDMLLSGRPTLFLGKYRLLECIGTGGMGAVFKARHGRMERTVALKVMSSAIVQNQRALARFRNEIQAAAALNHPNIVAAYDADCVGNVHFLVMEFVDGHDLGWYVNEGGALPIAWVCECIRQAALGLQHAHDRGMVHRDVKPTNVLVTQDPETGRPLAKLLDLGLARFASETELDQTGETSPQNVSGELTQAGQVLGTPDYMAPEQASNTRGADARSDIFSLGCTLYRLITGSFPFPGDTAAAKLLARQRSAARPLRELRPDASPQLEAVVAKMMARDPRDRYQTASEVAQALTPFTLPAGLSSPEWLPKGSREHNSGSSILPGDDARLEQFFEHLQTGESVDAPSRPSSRSSSSIFLQVPRKVWLFATAGVVTVLLAIAFWFWIGQVTLVIDWPDTDRRNAELMVNGNTVDMSQTGPVRVTGRSGDWDVRLSRPEIGRAHV